jgi:hypothetical protein
MGLPVLRGAGLLSQCGVWLRTGRTDDRSSILGRDKRFFPLAFVSRPALRPPNLLSIGYGYVLSPGVKFCRGVMPTSHPHLMPRSWMSRSYTSFPPCTSIGVLWDCFTFYLCYSCAFKYLGYSVHCLRYKESTSSHPSQVSLVPQCWTI